MDSSEKEKEKQDQQNLEQFLKAAWCVDVCEMQPLANISFRGPYFKLTNNTTNKTFFVAIIPENLLFVKEETT